MQRVIVGGQSRENLLAQLGLAGVSLNDSAKILMANPLFDLTEKRDYLVEERTVGELCDGHGAMLSELFAAAVHHGLELCPLIMGPYLRLAMPVQENASDSVLSGGRPPAGAIHIASGPVNDDVNYPKGFYLRVVDGRLWLRGFRCDDSYVLGPESRFAFVLPTPA